MERLQKDLQNSFFVKVGPATDKETACSYFSHHPFSIENKRGKFRRVTNATLIFQGQSLNSNFLKGPDLLSNLVGVILRLREQQLAISADIEQMFMQIKVAPPHLIVRFFAIFGFSGITMAKSKSVNTHDIFRRNIFPMHSVLTSSSFST